MKLIKFEKENCTPCTFVQNFLEDAGVEFEQVDAFDNPKRAAKFDIGSVPTVLLVDENEKEVERSVGYKPDELEQLISQL